MKFIPRHRDELLTALHGATGIAWDTCHKIYVLMDEAQMELMEEYGYDPLLRVDDPDEALEILQTWWDESCGLRFISTVETRPDPNSGFHDVIRQGDDTYTDAEGFLV